MKLEHELLDRLADLERQMDVAASKEACLDSAASQGTKRAHFDADDYETAKMQYSGLPSESEEIAVEPSKACDVCSAKEVSVKEITRLSEFKTLKSVASRYSSPKPLNKTPE